MKIINIRFYLPDFLKVQDKIEIPLDNLYKNSKQPIRLYFWKDEDFSKSDLKSLKSFMDKWEQKKYFKTIIKSSWFDHSKEFIWFDFLPVTCKHKPKWFRFSYTYYSADSLLKGMTFLRDILDFTTNSTFVKKQKRNDG
jgi:hypothetical protein